MILKGIWRVLKGGLRVLKGGLRVLKGVLRVFEGCCRVFEGCLKKINRGMKSVRPPPLYEIISQKIFSFSRMMASLSLILAHVGSDLLWNTPILPWTWIFPFPHFHFHWHVGLSMRWRSIFTRSKNIPLSLASIRAKPSCFGISLDWRLIPCDVTSQLNHAQLPTHGRVEARAEERKVETGGNSCRCRSRQRVG